MAKHYRAHGFDEKDFTFIENCAGRKEMLSKLNHYHAKITFVLISIGISGILVGCKPVALNQMPFSGGNGIMLLLSRY